MLKNQQLARYVEVEKRAVPRENLKYEYENEWIRGNLIKGRAKEEHFSRATVPRGRFKIISA